MLSCSLPSTKKQLLNTDKGIDLVSGNEEKFYYADIGAEIAKLEKENSNKGQLKDT